MYVRFRTIGFLGNLTAFVMCKLSVDRKQEKLATKFPPI